VIDIKKKYSLASSLMTFTSSKYHC